jgi:hypothetical protein
MTQTRTAQSACFNLRARICSALMCAVCISVYGDVITVTNTDDSGPGSLRQALTIANDGDTINFSLPPNRRTITLTSGGLGVAKNVAVSGLGADQLAIDGNGNQAPFVFGILPGKTVMISGLTIRNSQFGILNDQGALTVSSCVVSHNYDGLSNYEGTLTAISCVLSDNLYVGISNGGGNLSVSNCVISGNHSCGLSNGGGNISLTVASSTVSGNSGPGVYNSSHHGPPARTTALNGTSRRMPAGEWSDGGNCGGCMTIANSIVSGNSGPGVSNSTTAGGATATILNSTLTGNYADSYWYFGGGISTSGFEGYAQVTVGDSTITDNSAYGSGGGIGSDASFVTVMNSTISGNSAYSGGGISDGDFTWVTIVNSTISGNSAEASGGGIFNGYAGYVGIADSTCSGNSAASGGGIYNHQQPNASTVLEISNTILNAGASGENIFNDGGTVTSHGYNVCSDNGGGYLNGPGDQINTDPLLGPLQDNGGPTLTHAPLPGSPAIDAGNPNFTPPPYYDQRGPCYRRVFGRRIDVGSVEVQPGPRCPSPAPRPTPH